MLSPGKTRSRSIILFRAMALIALLAGAVGSLGFLLNEGRKTPVFLLILFIGWVLSPYMGLLVANVVSRRWSVAECVTLYCLMLVIMIGSLVAYSGVLTPPETRPAAIFLIVPLMSWVLMAIIIPVARYRSRSREGV